ncbi:MAG: chemotaxis protein CheR [Azoarcus sp.]|jgi:chemotaxis protein methyltransferase CheR|nr:chemotaxis protein CheR [Azoarcus sp.]
MAEPPAPRGTPSARPPAAAQAGPRPKPSPAAPAASGFRAAAVAQTLSTLGAAASANREFEFTSADFEQIRKLLYDHAGIALSPAKQDMVYSRLVRRLRACGDKSFSQYLQRLKRDRGEWETFINSLTTNLTSFFRESHHFEMLATQLKQIKEKRQIKIWCCAASTGEEPYSLAITACEAFSSLAPPVQIIASDIDTAVLAHGEQGRYRRDRVDRIPPASLGRYFTRNAEDESHTVRPELRRLVTFRRINLLSPTWAVQGPFDAIFCRNVMIYFDKATQYGILKRFAPLLRPDGRLYAGHSESFMHASDILRSLGRTVYVRLDSPLH